MINLFTTKTAIERINNKKLLEVQNPLNALWEVRIPITTELRTEFRLDLFCYDFNPYLKNQKERFTYKANLVLPKSGIMEQLVMQRAFLNTIIFRASEAMKEFGVSNPKADITKAMMCLENNINTQNERKGKEMTKTLNNGNKKAKTNYKELCISIIETLYEEHKKSCYGKVKSEYELNGYKLKYDDFRAESNILINIPGYTYRRKKGIEYKISTHLFYEGYSVCFAYKTTKKPYHLVRSEKLDDIYKELIKHLGRGISNPEVDLLVELQEILVATI